MPADKPPDNAAPPVGGPPVALSHESFTRTRDAVQYIEQVRRNSVSQAARRSPWTIPSVLVKTSSSITARSGTTIGTGSAVIQSLSTSTLVNDGITITLKNMTDKTIANGSYVLAHFTLGQWFAGTPGSCSNLS